MSYTLKTPVTQELITVSEVKSHMRILNCEEDALIESYLLAAIVKFQETTSRVISESTWLLTLDAFPVNGIIEIMRCSVLSVVSIKYTDSLGEEQVFDLQNTKLDAVSEPARLAPAFNQTWPTTASVINAVTIEFTAGNKTAISVNRLDKSAVFLMAAHWYRNREDVVVGKTANAVPKTSEDIMALRKIQNGF